MHKQGVALLVLLFLVGQISIVGVTKPGDMKHTSSSTPASVAVENVIDDPTFDSEPTTVTEDASGEFSSSYHPALDDEDFNYMELTWNHVANTSLDFRSGIDENLPDCFDFIYFYQQFDWLSNEVPLEADFQINFTTSLTGSFATEETGQLMFKVYVWTIDSSGHWTQILKTFPPYYDVYYEREAHFSYFELQETWAGMVENSSGLQEDPEDIVQVAIGLAPTFEFESHQGTEPWQFYDGAVSIRIKSMELWVYLEERPSPSQVLSPIYNSTWNYPLSEVFSNIPEEYENSSRTQFEDIETGSDGSVYVLSRVTTNYDFISAQNKSFMYQFLQKYSPKLNLVWTARNDNQTTAHAMAIHNGFIYTTGYIRTDDEYNNLIVTKWSSNGQKIWQTEWGGIYDEEGSAIAVASDGSIYVWASYQSIRFPPEFYKSSFLKFDSSGTLLWNKTSDVPLLPGRAALKMRVDGMYSWDTLNVVKRDLVCNPVWNISRPAYAVSFDDSGNIYIATTWYWAGPGAISDEWQMTVSKWNSNGIQLWESNYSIPLADGSYLNFQCSSIDVAPDGSILAILHEMHLTYDYHMVKFDSSGGFLWDKMIGDDHWPVYGGQEPVLRISETGLAYVGFQRWGKYGFEVAVSAFVVGPYSLGSDFQTMLLIGISGIALISVVLVVYIKKYR